MNVGDLVRYKSPLGLDYDGDCLQGLVISIDIETGPAILCTALCHDGTVRYFFINESEKSDENRHGKAGQTQCR